MLSPVIKILFEDFKKLVDIFIFIFKFGIGFGACCLIYYLIKIEFLPNEISLGDGFILFFIAIVFGVFFLFFLLGLISIGRITWDIIFIIFRNIPLKFQKYILQKVDKILGESKNNSNKILHFKVDFYGYFILIVLTSIPLIIFGFEWTGFMWVVVIGLFSYLFFSIIYNFFHEVNFLTKIDISTGEDNFYIAKYDNILQSIRIKRNNNENAIKICLVILIIFPLYFSSNSDGLYKIIKSTMEIINIRKSGASIYLKKDYYDYLVVNAEDVNKKIEGTENKQSKDFILLSSVNILFKGIGKSTYIEYEKDGNTRRLEVPNDAILNTSIILNNNMTKK